MPAKVLGQGLAIPARSALDHGNRICAGDPPVAADVPTVPDRHGSCSFNRTPVS